MTKSKQLKIEDLTSLIKKGYKCKDLLKELNVSKSTLYNYLRKYKLTIPKEELYFDNIDSDEKAYWLGFLYADGFVNGKYNNSVELSLKADDKEHLEKFNKFLKNKKPIIVSKAASINNKEYFRCRCIITDKYFHDRLIELGCVSNKSLILVFPPLKIFSNNDLVYSFIRGYIDGDGSITNTSRNKLRISILGTKEFLSSIQDIFKNKFGKLLSTRSSKKGINNYHIVSECSKAIDVGNLLYKNATVYLERKYKKFAELSRNT
jgi:DNA-binding transcriptional regulator WhiA